MSINKALDLIIEKIPVEFVFDSHFIIYQLIINYSDIYINFVSKFANKPNTTNTAHGHIAQLIKDLKGVKKLGYKSYSYNIRHKPSECTLWQKK